MIKPFVQWVGGKKRLCDLIDSLRPSKFDTYYEPFLGGGAVYFHLKPPKAVISDINLELIKAYRTIRDRPEDVFKVVQDISKQDNEKFYYAMRAIDPYKLSDLLLTARMIFLNRTCFNALYRVNRKGQFNVAYSGDKRTRAWPHLKDLIATSKQLKKAKILCLKWYDVLSKIKKGDFVYFDPPYYGLYSYYQCNGFTEEDHQDLADHCKFLDYHGIKFLLSNSDTPETREMYKDFYIHSTSVNYTVARRAEDRRPKAEILVRNYNESDEL